MPGRGRRRVRRVPGRLAGRSQPVPSGHHHRNQRRGHRHRRPGRVDGGGRGREIAVRAERARPGVGRVREGRPCGRGRPGRARGRAGRLPRPGPAGCAPDGCEPARVPPPRRGRAAGACTGPVPRPLLAVDAVDPGVGDGRCRRRRPAHQHGRPQRLPEPADGQAAVPHRGHPPAGRADGAAAGHPFRRHVQPHAAHHRHKHLQLGTGRGAGPGRGRGPRPARRDCDGVRHGWHHPRSRPGARRVVRGGRGARDPRRPGTAARARDRLGRAGRIIHSVAERLRDCDGGAGQCRGGARAGRVRSGRHRADPHRRRRGNGTARRRAVPARRHRAGRRPGFGRAGSVGRWRSCGRGTPRACGRP